MIYTLSLKKSIEDCHAAISPEPGTVRFVEITDEEAAEVLLLEYREPEFIEKYGNEYRAMFKGVSYVLEMQSTGKRLRSDTEIKVPFGLLNLMVYGAFQAGEDSRRGLTERLIGKRIKKDTPTVSFDVVIERAVHAENYSAVIINGSYVLPYSEATRIAETPS